MWKGSLPCRMWTAKLATARTWAITYRVLRPMSFLVKPDRLLEGEFEFDALLVHELAHLLCDPDLRELPMIAPEPPTSGFVRRLKNFVPDDWHHTERFFAIFVAGCRRLGELSGRSTLDTIAAGLRHEQWFDAEYLAQHCAD
jgi:hypothetical protein